LVRRGEPTALRPPTGATDRAGHHAGGRGHDRSTILVKTSLRMLVVDAMAERRLECGPGDEPGLSVVTLPIAPLTLTSTPFASITSRRCCWSP
jgi:hypothetical protein